MILSSRAGNLLNHSSKTKQRSLEPQALSKSKWRTTWGTFLSKAPQLTPRRTRPRPGLPTQRFQRLSIKFSLSQWISETWVSNLDCLGILSSQTESSTTAQAQQVTIQQSLRRKYRREGTSLNLALMLKEIHWSDEMWQSCLTEIQPLLNHLRQTNISWMPKKKAKSRQFSNK